MLKQIFSPPTVNPNPVNATPAMPGNPFMVTGQARFQAMGRNLPLERPQFMYHYGDTAVYGGARLFVLA
jgi:hypothetical protein